MSFRSWFVRLNKPLLLVLLLPLAALAWAAWSHYEKRYPSWYEEVRLSDGRVITIHQKRHYFKNYGTNQSWVTIDLPELGGKHVWHSYLMPMRVDVVRGTVYVFGRPRGPLQISIYKHPQSHLVAFKWTGLEFSRIPFAEIPESIKFEENTFPCVPSAKKSAVTIEEKDSAWCPPSGDRGQFTRKIDLIEYQKHANAMAALSNWANRSE